jgi:hypothetical protein
MPRVELQFHMAPAEAVRLGLRWAEGFRFRTVAEQFFPAYTAVELTGDSAPADVAELERVDRLAFCQREPKLHATSAHDFVAKNPDALLLSIGAQGDSGLRESALAGVTSDQALVRRWRSLVKTARASMHAGATVRNPMTGARQQLPNHLHTSGAHELAVQGRPMLAAAGWNEFVFDDCATPSARTVAGDGAADQSTSG